MPPRGVVEACQVAAALVVVGADLADQAVAEGQELGAAVEQAPAVAGMVERHRPLDRHLVVALDGVLERPAGVQVLDPQRRVLGDRPRADVGLATRVPVHGVVGEVPRHLVGVSGVQRFVVGADVVEPRAHRGHPFTRRDCPITGRVGTIRRMDRSDELMAEIREELRLSREEIQLSHEQRERHAEMDKSHAEMYADTREFIREQTVRMHRYFDHLERNMERFGRRMDAMTERVDVNSGRVADNTDQIRANTAATWAMADLLREQLA